MFGRKKKKPAQPQKSESQQPEQKQQPAENAADKSAPAGRVHSESLGDVWMALTGLNPSILIPQVVGTVLHAGGTRPPWKWTRKGEEFMLLAWPQDQPIRAAVLMSGPEGGQLKPVTAVPLLEGVPNDLLVESIHTRKEGMGGEVAVTMMENKLPMWFYDPLLGRDKDDLTPGVTHTFWLAAAAFGIRKALLDDITLTKGPQFEEYAAMWLKEHPGMERKDVPPLKVEVKGKPFIMPGRFFGEYQIRAIIDQVADYHFDKMPIKLLYFTFPFENRPNLYLPVYVSQNVYKDLELTEGLEIEAYIWLEGRIIDLEESKENNESDGKQN